MVSGIEMRGLGLFGGAGISDDENGAFTASDDDSSLSIYGGSGEIFSQIESPTLLSVGWIDGVESAIAGAEDDSVIEGDG